MRFRTFHERTAAPPVYRILRVLTRMVLVVWIPLAVWSGYRAIVQVFSLTLQAPASMVPGAFVRVDAVTSGRTTVTVSVLLEQGGRIVQIGRDRIRSSADPATDPRWRRGAVAVTIAEEQLGQLSAGPAVVRVVAVGQSQFLRIPPPTVRTQRVTIGR